MLETYEKHSRRKLIATFLAIVVIAGAVLLTDYFKSSHSSAVQKVAQTDTAATSTTSAPDPSVSSATSATSPTSTANLSGYADGTYTASSDYYVPHSDENIEVSLTLSGGVVTNASIQNSEGDNESARYQEDFAAVYKKYVVGKKISGLQLGVIAGASDTTQGFDDALSQIASKARA